MTVNAAELVGGFKISSVVPAAVTGEAAVHELCNMDLAMKLHYLRAVYYFRGEAVQGLDLAALKIPMFRWLDVYCTAAGRIRRADPGGRPRVKCNDGGVRIVEAQCRVALEEWLEMKAEDMRPLHQLLVSGKIVGPDLFFSPLVYIQFTRFKCGGVALGFSWAHVLGDPFVASRFLSLWAQHLAGSPLPQSIKLPTTTARRPEKPPSDHVGKPLPAKPVDPVGESWLPTNRSKMETNFLLFPDQLLKDLKSRISDPSLGLFEAIAALIWKSLAKIRSERETGVVTVCRRNRCLHDRDLTGELFNGQAIGAVEAGAGVIDADLSELAALIAAAGNEDRSMEIEAMVDYDSGSPDLIVYGANLTFVDLEGVDPCGVELKGQKPMALRYGMDGVGDEGAVLVLPEAAAGSGSYVTVILPEGEGRRLRDALEREWRISFTD